MASDADMEDYGFEYSDEEQEEQDVDIENQYYNSKDNMDPYVLLTCRTQEQKSNVASGQGTTPEWNETFIFTVSEGTTELKAKIFDKDVGTEDDSVGEATIPLEPVFVEGSVPPTAYNVVKDEEYKGEIWIAVSFKPSENRNRGMDDESYGGWKNSEASY